jgi:hypothetical protein
MCGVYYIHRVVGNRKANKLKTSQVEFLVAVPTALENKGKVTQCASKITNVITVEESRLDKGSWGPFLLVQRIMEYFFLL